MLVSHKERDEVVHKLQQAFLDGQLEDSELEERISIALKARTKEQLYQLLKDIYQITVHQHNETQKETSLALFSGIERGGIFHVPQKFRCMAVFGGSKIDFSKAIFSSLVTELRLTAVFGGIEIILPPKMRIFLNQRPIVGGIIAHFSKEELPSDAPSIHIRAAAILGGIEINTNHLL